MRGPDMVTEDMRHQAAKSCTCPCKILQSKRKHLLTGDRDLAEGLCQKKLISNFPTLCMWHLWKRGGGGGGVLMWMWDSGAGLL
jgi:hypothetical protein